MQIGTKKLLTLLTAFFFCWLGLRFVLPLTMPFLLGTLLALSAEPMTKLLTGKLHFPRSAASALGVTISFFFFTMLLLLLCAFVMRELRSLAGILPQLETTVQSGLSLLQTRLLTFSDRMPEGIQPILQENILSLFSNGTGFLNQAVRYFLELAGNLLTHIPNSALTLGTAILSGYMISAKLPKLRSWILSKFSQERIHALLRTSCQLKKVITGWLLAQAKLMGVTFCILFPGLLLLRIPNSLLWAAGISLVDAFPVLGVGTVLIPWSLISFLQQNTARAIGLAGIYITVSLIRSALEPKFVGRHLNLDPLVTLIAMYAGFQLWGIGGMLLSPLITVTALQLVPAPKNRR